MTIKELAQELSISTQAIYQRLKTAGIHLDNIKRDKSAHLTDEGITQIRAMFGKTVENSTNKPTDQLTALQIENALLKERIAELTADRDRWAAMAAAAQEQATAAQQTAQQAQALNLGTLKALPAPRRSLLSWLKREK